MPRARPNGRSLRPHRRPVPVLLGFAVAVALMPWSAAPARAATSTIPGIDVSQYQNTIDWTAVNHDRVGFVIMRATKGSTELDTAYATNLAGATDNGFILGAYHRATPSSAAGDAVAEADHFVAIARNAAGDLLPALDIEEAGGLSVGGLRDWVRTWLARVHHQLGVRPMIYSSPNFWRTSMGDSTWFATHGYPLWIAHWYVPAPDVFANDWGGHGWTFWQWTSTGSVSGITTDVDRDRFDGTDLAMARIASLTVTSAPGGLVEGDRISCGDGSTSCARLANPGDQLTLTATPDAGATLMGWTGACASAGTSPTCTVTAIGDLTTAPVFGYPVSISMLGTGGGTVMSSPLGLDCVTDCSEVFAAGSPVTLTAIADSASVFGAWSGPCSGSSSTCDLTVNGPTTVGARFDASVQLQEDGAGTSFTWALKTDPRALGHSYRWEHRAGASTTFAFQGGAVSLFTLSGPGLGKATVSIDGTQKTTINGYAASLRFGVEHRFDQLGSGEHTITIAATGTAGPRATGTRVGVDALRWGGTLHASPHAASSAWSTVTDASAGEGAYVWSDVAGASASLSFTGTGVTWITARGPGMGLAEIWVDGTLERTVDLYAASAAFGVLRSVTGLTDAPHMVTVVVRGTHRAAATGSSVAVDAWIIR
jgi:GH25 family lysozyme M1 (1,4-beta-N-acetylmuramidase)